MPKTYTFTDNTNSFTIRVDGAERSIEYTGGKNFCELQVSNVTENKYLSIRSNSAEFTEIVINMEIDTILGIGAGSTTATELRDSLLSSGLFFLDESGVGGGVLFEGINPPSDTSKLWFNTNDEITYFYDGSDWLSEQIFDVVFNQQGTTPNNTFFRIGNAVGDDLGNGYSAGFDLKIKELSFNRDPNTSQAGTFWLYSNEQTNNNNAVVICTFLVGTEARGVETPNVETTISNGNYMSMRWSGNETNNNVIVLKFRKKHV